MNFCSRCGAPVRSRIPDGDDRPRFVCDSCGVIHYRNPKIVVGCIPEWDEQVLLCRRSIDPKYGKWTLPAGYLENGETLADGAIRETWEEARAEVKLIAPYAVMSLIFVNQIYFIFRARLCNTDFRPGKESTDVRLFEEKEIPWEELAFTVVQETLRQYFEDRPKGIFPVHTGTVSPPPAL